MGVFLEMKAWLKHLFPLWKCIEKMSSIKKRTRYHQNVSVKLHFSKICTIPTIIYTHVQSSSNDDLNSIYFVQRWFSALNFINRTKPPCYRGEPWGWSIYETKPYLILLPETTIASISHHHIALRRGKDAGLQTRLPVNSWGNCSLQQLFGLKVIIVLHSEGLFQWN